MATHGSGGVTLEELTLGVELALDPSFIGLCRLVDTDEDELVGVDELVMATRSRLTPQVGVP